MRFLVHRVGQEGGAGARKREGGDEYDAKHHEKNEDAAFRTRSTAAQPGGTGGVSGEQAVGADAATVCDAEEEGLRPVPRSVQTDGPPQRAGAPQAEGEHQARTTGAEKADGGLARIQAMHEAKAEGDEHGRAPETDCLNVAAGGRDMADESRQAICQAELQIAAEEKLLKEADADKADCPHEAIANRRQRAQQNAGEDEVVRAPQDDDEQRLKDEPQQSADEQPVQATRRARETVIEGAAVLDAAHDPGGEEDEAKLQPLGDG